MGESERIKKYEVEIARLDELHADLERLWEQVPKYGYIALLAPIVWWFWGFGWAVVELFVTGALVGTQAYLIGMRKSENRWNRRHVAEDLERLKAELGSPS